MKLQAFTLFALLAGAWAIPNAEPELQGGALAEPAFEARALEPRAVVTKTITRRFTRTLKNGKTTTRTRTVKRRVTKGTTTTKTKKTTKTTTTTPTSPAGGCGTTPVTTCTSSTAGCPCTFINFLGIVLSGTCGGGILGGANSCNII